MFMFAYNQCRPECCPSTFSCDHGCVCTTEQQRNFINSRGNPQIKGHAYPGIWYYYHHDKYLRIII